MLLNLNSRPACDSRGPWHGRPWHFGGGGLVSPRALGWGRVGGKVVAGSLQMYITSATRGHNHSLIRAERHCTHSEGALNQCPPSASTVGYKTQVDRPGLLNASCGMIEVIGNSD
jgi:hypothetical protein